MSPVVKFDVSGSDPEAATRDFEPPVPGVYKMKVQSIKVAKPPNKDRRIELVLEVTGATGDKKKYNGGRVWDYINLESEAAAWKLDQFLQAFGLATKSKRKGQFNPDNLLGELVTVRVASDTNQNGDYRPRVGALIQFDEDADEEGDDSEDEGEDEEPEEDDADDSEEAEDEDGDFEEEEGESEEDLDYDAMSIAELKEELESRDLSTKGSRGALVKRLQKNDQDPFEEE